MSISICFSWEHYSVLAREQYIMCRALAKKISWEYNERMKCSERLEFESGWSLGYVRRSFHLPLGHHSPRWARGSTSESGKAVPVFRRSPSIYPLGHHIARWARGSTSESGVATPVFRRSPSIHHLGSEWHALARWCYGESRCPRGG